MQKQQLNFQKQQLSSKFSVKQNQFKRENQFTSNKKYSAFQPDQLDFLQSKKVKLSNENQEPISQKYSNKKLQHKHNQYLINNQQDLTCKICMEKYNLNRKMPIVACQNKHVFCLQCIIQSLSHKNMKCPLCRVLVEPIQKDEIIFAQLKKNTKSHPSFDQMTKFKLKLNKKFPAIRLNHFQIIDKTTLSKIKDNDDWSCLVFQKLPSSLKPTKKNIKILQKENANIYMIKFTYEKILQNCISFGLFVFDEFTQTIIHNIGFQSHLFQYFTKKQKRITQNSKSVQINLIVNLNQKILLWVNKQNQIIAQQSLQVRGIGDISYEPFIAVKKKGDTIII